MSDDELRSLWKAADAYEGPFGAYIKFLLLSATRRNEAADMKRSELVDAATWVIPASRYKTALDTLIPLSRAAQDVINKVPAIGPGDFVFTYDGRRPIEALSVPRKSLTRLPASPDGRFMICDGLPGRYYLDPASMPMSPNDVSVMRSVVCGPPTIGTNSSRKSARRSKRWPR